MLTASRYLSKNTSDRESILETHATETIVEFRKKFPSLKSRLKDGERQGLEQWVARQPAQALWAQFDRLIEQRDFEEQQKLSQAKQYYDGHVEDQQRKHQYELERQRTNLRLDHERHLNRAISEKDRETTGICRQYENTIAKHEKKIKDLGIQIQRDVQRITSERDDEIARVETSLATIISQRDAKITDLNRMINEAAEDHAAEIENEKAAYLQDRQQLENKHESNLAACHQAMESLEIQAASELRNTNDQHARYSKEQDQRHADEISQLTLSRDAQEEALKSEHKAESLHLQHELQQFRNALMARDESVYQGELFAMSDLQKTDRQLEADFQGLQTSVEQLGRLPWKMVQDIWPEELLGKWLSQHGHRVLKRAMLQDCIWTILFQHVFASPFRVFGQEGLSLETEWFEQCSDVTPAESDTYLWPAANVQSERWRYMTIKECVEAIRKPLPSEWDPRGRLKKGFAESLQETVEVLQSELGQMIDLDSRVLDSFRRLFKKAAALWLEMGKHRCRVVIQLYDMPPRSMPEKVAHVRQGSGLHFTVLPTVGRYGNAKGVDLGSFTTIGDCKGEGLEVS